MTSSSPAPKMKPFPLIRQFASDFLRPHARSCAAVGALMVLCVLLQLPVPVLMMYIIDHTVSSKNTDLLTKVSLLLAALVVTKHIFSYLNETLTLRVKEDIILESRLQTMSRGRTGSPSRKCPTRAAHILMQAGA